MCHECDLRSHRSSDLARLLASMRAALPVPVTDRAGLPACTRHVSTFVAFGPHGPSCVLTAGRTLSAPAPAPRSTLADSLPMRKILILGVNGFIASPSVSAAARRHGCGHLRDGHAVRSA